MVFGWDHGAMLFKPPQFKNRWPIPTTTVLADPHRSGVRSFKGVLLPVSNQQIKMIRTDFPEIWLRGRRL